MKLPESLTTVNTLSKILAAVIFITSPFLGFYLGIRYQKNLIAIQTSTDIGCNFTSVTDSLKKCQKKLKDIEDENKGRIALNEFITKVSKISPSSEKVTEWKTYNSTCQFSVKLPKTWNAQKYFGVDSDVQCAYLTGPDYELGLDSRGGNYVDIAKVNRLSNNIKDLASFVTNQQSFGSESLPQANVDKTIGPFSGKIFMPAHYEPGVSFAFQIDNYIYDVNWSGHISDEDIETVMTIISTIKF